MNTTVQSETELSSVNSILMAIGQAPITRIYEKKVYQDPNISEELIYTNPEVSIIHKILLEVSTDVQNEGWVWNRESHYPLTPDANGHIEVPNNILRMDVYENDIYRTSDLVKREGKLYDKLNHTYTFPVDKSI